MNSYNTDEHETLYNIYDEAVIVTEQADGTATALFENGASKTFSNCEKAIATLYKMGYRF